MVANEQIEQLFPLSPDDIIDILSIDSKSSIDSQAEDALTSPIAQRASPLIDRARDASDATTVSSSQMSQADAPGDAAPETVHRFKPEEADGSGSDSSVHDDEPVRLKSALKKPNREPEAHFRLPNKKKNRVRFDETFNTFLECDYVIYVDSDDEYGEPEDEPEEYEIVYQYEIEDLPIDEEAPQLVSVRSFELQLPESCEPPTAEQTTLSPPDGYKDGLHALVAMETAVDESGSDCPTESESESPVTEILASVPMDPDPVTSGTVTLPEVPETELPVARPLTGILKGGKTWRGSTAEKSGVRFFGSADPTAEPEDGNRVTDTSQSETNPVPVPAQRASGYSAFQQLFPRAKKILQDVPEDETNFNKINAELKDNRIIAPTTIEDPSAENLNRRPASRTAEIRQRRSEPGATDSLVERLRWLTTGVDEPIGVEHCSPPNKEVREDADGNSDADSAHINSVEETHYGPGSAKAPHYVPELSNPVVKSPHYPPGSVNGPHYVAGSANAAQYGPGSTNGPHYVLESSNPAIKGPHYVPESSNPAIKGPHYVPGSAPHYVPGCTTQVDPPPPQLPAKTSTYRKLNAFLFKQPKTMDSSTSGSNRGSSNLNRSFSPPPPAELEPRNSPRPKPEALQHYYNNYNNYHQHDNSYDNQSSSGADSYSLDDIDCALHQAYSHGSLVLPGELSDEPRGSGSRSSGSSGDSGIGSRDTSISTEAGSDELAAFVQQDQPRIERIRKRYNATTGSDDDETEDYGFLRRPSVRGIKPRFVSTSEILQQMRQQLVPHPLSVAASSRHSTQATRVAQEGDACYQQVRMRQNYQTIPQRPYSSVYGSSADLYQHVRLPQGSVRPCGTMNQGLERSHSTSSAVLVDPGMYGSIRRVHYDQRNIQRPGSLHISPSRDSMMVVPPPPPQHAHQYALRVSSSSNQLQATAPQRHAHSYVIGHPPPRPHPYPPTGLYVAPIGTRSKDEREGPEGASSSPGLTSDVMM